MNRDTRFRPSGSTLMRQWSERLGVAVAAELRIGDMHALWPGKSDKIGVAAEPGEEGQEPWKVWFVPLGLYGQTIGALTDRGPHRRDALLMQALGLDCADAVDLRRVLGPTWKDRNLEAVLREQAAARLPPS